MKTHTRISFYTLGCRLNQSETAGVQRTFEANGGYTVVDFGEPADVVVVNTCTVTENGDADTQRLVNKINRKSPGARIALIGCQAQTQKERLAALPNVRWVVGNARKTDFLSIFEASRFPEKPQVIAPAIPRGSFTSPGAAIDPKHTRVNLKIQDGCDFFCSFCEIPYARSRARSRQFDDIAREALLIVEAGRKEIVLTGVNIGTYDYQEHSILEVVDTLARLPGLERIRLSSIEPTTIPPALTERMQGDSKLCRHLHVPLQSASNEILQIMKRRYSAEEFGRFIDKIHKDVPGICIGTDVIVGFPGETDGHFRETVDRLVQWPIHYIHVFSYSVRTMAKSRALGGMAPVDTINHRSKLLRRLSSEKYRSFTRSLIGTVQKVLFEQHKDGFWMGLTDNYVRVFCASSENLENQFRKVRIDVLDGHRIMATLI